MPICIVTAEEFSMRFSCLVLLLMTGARAIAVGQSSELSGTVTDASGGVVVDGTVSVLTVRRAVVATTRTDGSGRFTFRDLAPGQYVVRVEATGFDDREVPLSYRGESTDLPVELEVAGVSEAVTVTASPGFAEETRSAAQPVNDISQEDLFTRVRTVAAQAVTEETGVMLQQTSPTMAGVFIRGLTGTKVNVYMDGVRYTTGAQRGGVNTFLDLIESSTLEEIEILRGPNSAEYGSDALGGSIQFLTRVPELGGDEPRIGFAVGAGAQTAHQGGHGNASLSYGRRTFGIFAGAAGRGVGEIRTGDGIDSHAAVTRFLGLPSDRLMEARLPDTGYSQFSGLLKANWTPNPSNQIVAFYAATRQDGGNRYDQMLGGDGNLIAELNDMTLDFFYLRMERERLGWFDHGSLTYSLNSQREERVNQGGNGNPRATIGHEPERTTANGVNASFERQLSERQSLHVGGEVYFEKLTSDSFDVNPVTGAESPRRPRVPSDATYVNGGLWAETSYEVPSRLRIVGALRWGGASYEAKASNAPIVNGQPLWPDDSLSVGAFSFRVGAVAPITNDWTLQTSFSRGYRAPSMTDLGTLGLTGSGFEVAAPDVAGLNGTVGDSAAAGAVSSGQPVEQVTSETSLNFDASARYNTDRVRAEVGFFVNNIHDNIQKQSLILPPGAVGTVIGGQPIVAQGATGTVFVSLSTNPVLVRDNFDNARIWGIEHRGDYVVAKNWRVGTIFTYLRAEDTTTGLPPNIEGGTPPPEGWLTVMYTTGDKRFWVQPYLHAAAEQTHLSSLDQGDRRTGASRSRTNIRNFFLNGATARGWVSPGADGTMGTADDLLTTTGETLAQVQDRVLGVGVNSAVLFPAVQAYTVLGIRGGMRFGRHEILAVIDNLTDENYRGISWGLDAPGIGFEVRFIARF
jgi:outer membrane receptor for ferrienterochelin and colicin